MTSEAILPRPSRHVACTMLQAAALPASDLTDEHMEHFFFCGPAAMPRGLVGLEFCGPDALLRSLVVTPDCRSIGLGSALVDHAESYARSRGARAIFLLTTTAEAFFAHRGYVTATRARLHRRHPSTRGVRRPLSGELRIHGQENFELRFPMKRLHIHVSVDDVCQPRSGSTTRYSLPSPPSPKPTTRSGCSKIPA